MSKLTKIPKDAKLQQCIDIANYKNVKPAIYNMYYRANLLEIIDQLPEQIKKEPQEQIYRANLNEPVGADLQRTQVNNQSSSDKEVVLINVEKATKHQSDTLGNDTMINGYAITKTFLGRGSHSFVKLAKKQGKFFAIKIISYDRLKKRIIIKDQHITKMINSQIVLLMELKSDNIIGFQKAIYLQSKQRVFIILQYCSKGSLFKIINSAPPMSIPQWHQYVKKYMLQIARGLQAMHQRFIIHRDMKSQNVLVNQKDQVKIIDFNVSSKLSDNFMVLLTDKFIGTKTYAPPQLLIPSSESKKVDGRLIDVWALGITYWQLLQRSHPFNVSTPAQLIKKVQSPPQFNPKYDPVLKDLLLRMLQIQNSKRITVEQILRHPWFKN